MSAAYHFHDKILVLRFARLGHTPPARYATELLYEHGYPVLVVEFGTLTDTIEQTLSDPLPKLRLPGSWQTQIPGKLRALFLLTDTFVRLAKKILNQGRPRLIVAHGLPEQAVAFFLHHAFRIPYVVHVHETYDVGELKSLVSQWLLRISGPILRQAEFLIFPEKTRAEVYRRRFKFHTPVHIVYNSARLQPFPEPMALRNTLGVPKGTRLVGYFGGISPDNLLLETIEALRALPEAHLLLWGWGEEAYLASLKSEAKSKGLEARVHFMGQMNEDKWRTIAALDASLCVYRPDKLRLKFSATASNKLMESIAMGVPVITSSSPDYREIAVGLDVGVAVEQMTPAGLADALRQLLFIPEVWERKSRNAKTTYREFLNFEFQFQKALQAYSPYALHPPSAKTPMAA